MNKEMIEKIKKAGRELIEAAENKGYYSEYATEYTKELNAAWDKFTDLIDSLRGD